MKVLKLSVQNPSCFLQITITHKRITEPKCITFELFFGNSLFCDYRTELLLEVISLGNHCESWITETFWVHLTEMFWELYSVILVEELPNRNYFRINPVIFLCTMVLPLGTVD